MCVCVYVYVLHVIHIEETDNNFVLFQEKAKIN